MLEFRAWNLSNNFFELVEDGNFNILQRWKESERHFPIVIIIAKQILSMSVSTEVVEQDFSADENIFDESH